MLGGLWVPYLAKRCSDGKTGVGAQLRQVKPHLMHYHCHDHRLALALQEFFCQGADKDRPDTRGTEQVLQVQHRPSRKPREGTGSV